MFFVVLMVKTLRSQIGLGKKINIVQFIINRSPEDGEYTDKKPQELEEHQDEHLECKADRNDERDERSDHPDVYDDAMTHCQPDNRQCDSEQNDDLRSDHYGDGHDGYGCDDNGRDRCDDRQRDGYDKP